MEVEKPTPHGFDFDLPPNSSAFFLEVDSTAADAPVDLESTALDASPQLPEIESMPPAVDGPQDSAVCQPVLGNSSQGAERDATLICENPEQEATAAAAVKLQKVYRSYRTRRRLADSAVVVEELWWQAIDFARLNHSTVSFFNYSKPESAASRWTRVSLNASKVGKGLSKDAKALKLAFQHWIEAIDPRHRYGHNLHYYYDEWCNSDAGQPFFYWLDIGDGRNVDLKGCPRSSLREQVVKYLGPQEREYYEYVPREGKITHKLTGELLDTTKGPEKTKWIFVMSTTKKLYAGKKKKGMFHHSSFLAGGATLAAGRLVAEDGELKHLWAYSGHYRPGEENLNNVVIFLKENGIDPNKVQINALSNEDYYDDNKQVKEEKVEKEEKDEKVVEAQRVPKPPQLEIPKDMASKLYLETTVIQSAKVGGEHKAEYKRTLSGTLSGGLQSPRANVPQNAILKRIKSKEKTRSYQLGYQLSSTWSTGAGPRIGCVKDYPLELRVQALEFVNLSPRVPTPSTSRRFTACFHAPNMLPLT